MQALIFSMEDGRTGPPRMPEALHRAGIGAAALCPAGNPLGESLFTAERFDLPDTRSMRVLSAALVGAIERSGARIVLPGDEQAVVLMHRLLHSVAGGDLLPATRQVLAASLGAPDRFEPSLFKSDTLHLAQHLGIRVPCGGTVATLDQALRTASRLGYPVYLKESFSWAGFGVRRCRNEAELSAAFRGPGKLDGVRTRLRALFGRDWFPVNTRCDVQGAVAGTPVLFCGFAWQGRMLGGYAGHRLELLYPDGPSRSIRLRHDPELARAACAMIDALGFSGFFSFDFIRPNDGTGPVLLECNPRLVPATHLGARLGVDLMAMLAQCLRGAAPRRAPVYPTAALDVLLFPYSLTPRPHERGLYFDGPEQDFGLLDAVMRGRAAA